MPKQERAVRTRNRVILGAAKVFYDHGYAAANISEILRSAGVTKGAMYFHFESKEELAKAVIDEQRAWMHFRQDTTTPLQDLINMVNSFARALETDVVASAGVRLVIERGFVHPYAGSYEDWIEAVQQHLKCADQRGDLRTDIDLHEIAVIIAGSFTGIHIATHTIGAGQALHRRITDLWRMLLPSIVRVDHYRLLDLHGIAGPENFQDSPN